jgi:GNAT superfamily N-acetyltransferase
MAVPSLDTQIVGRAAERADVRGKVETVRAAKRIAPQLGAELLEIAGGVAAFAGVGSPLSEASGLDLAGQVSDGDVAAVTAFYERNGSPARIVVSPLGGVNLAQRLAAAGYRPVELQNLLAAAIDRVAHRRDARITESRDPAEWGRASAAGFIEREPEESEALVGEILAAVRSVTTLEVRQNGTIVATAAMDVQGDYAALFAASTAPSVRRTGLQRSLILDRVARAHERGAKVAFASGAVASGSERNFRRLGFEVLCTRAVWERPISTK